MKDFIKTIISALQEWTNEKIQLHVKNSVADWGQNDPNEDNYIKNRTHWEDSEPVSIQEKIDFSNSVGVIWGDKLGYFERIKDLALINGEKYTVFFDGTEYDCIAFKASSDTAIGNKAFVANNVEDNGLPFVIINFIGETSTTYAMVEDRGTHNFLINGKVKVVHKLDSKYLDIPNNIATTDDIQEAIVDKMNVQDPTGVGTFSINRKEDTLVGSGSIVQGTDLVAERKEMVVTGSYNKYSQQDPYVYTEQEETTLSASVRRYFSDSFSFDEQRGIFSLNEPKVYDYGYNCVGKYSLFSTSSATTGSYLYFVTSVDSARKKCQCKYYRSLSPVDARDKNLFVIGNGVSDIERSNAHTLDWDGNAWYAGEVYVGGEDQNSAEKLAKISDIPDISNFATEDYVNSQIATIPTPDVSGQIDSHNTSISAHNDIRLLVDELTNRLNTLADSDDVTLDQMSELVEYIKSNKTLIEEITTKKVNVSDIINNLTTNVDNKPLSAAQGVVLKELIDAIKVPTKVSELTNDSGYLTEHQSLEGLATEEYVDSKTADDFGIYVQDTEPADAVAGDIWIDTASQPSDAPVGYIPVKGVDYFTPEEIKEIARLAAQLVNEMKTFTVKFFNYNGTLLETITKVAWGSDVKYPNDTPVRLNANESEDWEFVGWDPEPNNITEDMDCVAQFKNKVGTTRMLVGRKIQSYSNDTITKIGIYAMYYCDSLTSIHIPSVTSFGKYALGYCSALESIYAPNLKSVGEGAFCGCNKLKVIDLPLLSGMIDQYTFMNCTSLESFRVPTAVTVYSNAFQGCSSLTRLEAMGHFHMIRGSVFLNSSLDTLILRGDGVSTLSDANCFSNTPIASGSGYIYVPGTLVERYQTATNWSVYAAQIRAIEDYPEICGGES